jgi:VanZ family protein
LSVAEPIIALVPRSAIGRWLPVVMWAAVIFALSSFPSLDSGLGTWDLALRKAAHVGEYAVLGALLARAIGRSLPAFLVAVAYAASDELHQHFVPGRTGTVVDTGIDALGAALGVVAYLRVSSS